jgi:hypothetical protein
MKLRIAIHLLALLAGACATSFQGSAMVEGGRRGCERKCAANGLQMQSFVFMGEYSTACVCDVPGHTAHVDSAAEAAAVGVMTQMRDAEQQYCDREDCSRLTD